MTFTILVLWLWGRRKVNCVIGFQLDPVSAQVLGSENVSTGSYLWLAMDLGKLSLVKLLGRFVNAHGSPAIPPVTTSLLRRGERGHVHIYLIFSSCGFDFDCFYLFFSAHP